MKKIKKFIPLLIFLFTIIQGGVLIVTSEKAQQQKEKMAVNQVTFAGECGSDHKGCENKEEPKTVTCWNGEVKNCTFVTKFSYDPCADDPNANGACGKNYSPPACTQCGEQIIGDCSCPPQPPTATPIPPPPPTVTLPSPRPTATPIPPSATPIPPTATPIPPTATPIPTNTPKPTPIPTTPPGQPTNTPAPTATNTPVPSATPGPGPSATPIPVLCGTKDCDNATNPCRSGYICVQAHDGSNYCTSSDFQTACKANPSYNNCCTAPGAPTATPTEIIIAKASAASPTQTTKLLQTGTLKSFIFIIPALIMLAGLIL